jgi:hypothetical protein
MSSTIPVSKSPFTNLYKDVLHEVTRHLPATPSQLNALGRTCQNLKAVSLNNPHYWRRVIEGLGLQPLENVDRQETVKHFYERLNAVVQEAGFSPTATMVYGRFQENIAQLKADEQLRKKTFELILSSHKDLLPEIFHYLLREMPPLQPNDAGELLDKAISKGCLKSVQALFLRSTINHRDICWAVMEATRKVEILQALLNHDPSKPIRPTFLSLALAKAAKKNHLASVHELLRYDSTQGGLITNAGLGDALKKAARNGHLPVVQMLLQYYFDPHYAGLALRSAARKGHLEVVNEVLTHDAANGKLIREKDIYKAMELAYNSKEGSAEARSDIIAELELHMNPIPFIP